jgi:hypothetical protein
MELTLKPLTRYAIFLSVQAFCPKISFSIILTSQDLPDLPPLDADKIIRDAAKIINGDPFNAELNYMKRRKTQMNIFRKVRYALKGNNDLEMLAVEMERYIDALMKMCSPNVARVSN